MSRVKVYEGSSTVRIAAPRASIWRWLRTVESAPYWHPDCVHAYTDPNSPEGIGERHVLVTQQADGTTVSADRKLVHFAPYDTLAFRELTLSESTIRIDLSDSEGQTVLQVTVSAHSPKKSFRRWVNPTPALASRARLIAGLIASGLEHSRPSH